MSLCTVRSTPVLVLSILSLCCLQVLGDHAGAGTCPELHAPSYGSLTYNNSVVTTDQPDWRENDTVEYRCANGYQLVGYRTTVCGADGNWTVEGDQVVCRDTEELPLQQILIIVSAVLGTFCLVLILAILLLCCKMCSMYAKLKEGSVAEDEVAFARSQGVVSVNNPLMRMGMKEEDAAGNPLYLTPDELTDFEQQMTGTMTS